MDAFLFHIIHSMEQLKSQINPLYLQIIEKILPLIS